MQGFKQCFCDALGWHLKCLWTWYAVIVNINARMVVGLVWERYRVPNHGVVCCRTHVAGVWCRICSRCSSTAGGVSKWVQNQNPCALICQISHVGVIFDHVIRVFDYCECRAMLVMQNHGWQGQKTKSWHGAHEVENETSYLEMKIQSQTHQTWLLDDESRKKG